MKGLSEAAALTTERDAIRDGRLLLDDPDKVEPLVHRAADVLRTAMNKNFGAYRGEYDRCTRELEAAPQWGKLAPEDRAAILRDEADLDAWLAEVRKTVLAKLSDGPVQL